MSVVSPPSPNSRRSKWIAVGAAALAALCTCCSVAGYKLFDGARDFIKGDKGNESQRGPDLADPGSNSKTPTATPTRTPSPSLSAPSATDITPPSLATPPAPLPSPEGPQTGAVVRSWVDPNYSEPNIGRHQYKLVSVVVTDENGIAAVGTTARRKFKLESSDEMWVERYEIRDAKRNVVYQDDRWNSNGTNRQLGGQDRQPAGNIGPADPTLGSFVDATGKIAKDGQYTATTAITHKDGKDRKTAVTYSFRFKVTGGIATQIDGPKLTSSGAHKFQSGLDPTGELPPDITPAAYTQTTSAPSSRFAGSVTVQVGGTPPNTPSAGRNASAGLV